MIICILYYIYYTIKSETLKIWSVGTGAFIRTFIINGLQTKLVGFKQNINKSKYKDCIASKYYECCFLVTPLSPLAHLLSTFLIHISISKIHIRNQWQYVTWLTFLNHYGTEFVEVNPYFHHMKYHLIETYIRSVSNKLIYTFNFLNL